MHAVFLDYKTVDANDLDLGSIKAFLPEIMIYSFSNEGRSPDSHRRR